MKSNLILEELKRAQLLMGYNTKMTLTENESEIIINEKYELGEQSTKAFLKGFFGIGDDVISKLKTGKASLKTLPEFGVVKGYFDDIFNNKLVGGLKRIDGTLISTSDEVLEALAKGTLDKNGLSNLAKGLMKSGKIAPGPFRRKLVDMAADLSIESKQFLDKSGNLMSKKQIKKTLTNKGYNPEMADEIAEKVLQKSGGPGKTKPIKTGTQTTNITDNTVQVNITQYIRTYGAKALTALKGQSRWGVLVPYLAGAGSLGLLMWLFSKSSKDYFPECIGAKILSNPKMLDKMVKENLPINSAYMNDESNPQLKGAMVTSPSVGSKTGSITLADGSKGTYKHIDDKIEINAGGNVFLIDCSAKIQVIDDGGSGEEPKPAPGGGCTPTSDFPFAYYQMNSMVGQVQNCVGSRADNCMGPQTAGKIQQFLGLSETPTALTKDIYDKVMAKCKGSTSNENKPIKEPVQTSGSVTGGGEKPSSEEDFEF